MIALVTLTGESLRIAGLEILSLWRLNVDQRIIAAARRVSWAESTVCRLGSTSGIKRSRAINRGAHFEKNVRRMCVVEEQW